jgi:anti-anti-sigma regulatory factor
VSELQDNSIIALSGKFTLSNISEAHRTLLEVLDIDTPVSIDIDGVTEADLSFVQLIESARRAFAERGQALSLRNGAGEAVLPVLRRGGFLDPSDPSRTSFWLKEGANL